MQACIEGKTRFVVDNTNVTRDDRARYIALAREAAFRVIGYYHQSALHACIEPMLSPIQVDLSRPPEDRWHFDAEQKQAALELVAMYTRDLGIGGDMAGLAVEMARSVTPDDYWQELESVARELDTDLAPVVVANLYFDALKATIGCTAFAVPTPTGPLHARNLDWWTENQLLSRATVVVSFSGGNAGDFEAVGWPGFVGVFSGVASNRFAVTLNAVLSGESALPALPVVFLLRRILEDAPSYQEALATLTSTTVCSDSLLLLTGTHNGEMAVIERTPTRHAVRKPMQGFVTVTNDYLSIDTNTGAPTDELQTTACSRRERIEHLLNRRRPATPEACLDYLSDDQVKMAITVQQMVFSAASGLRVLGSQR